MAEPVMLNGVLASARCCVCVGPGGVGKTSTSAAMALEGAQQGRRTIVLTIDPARRLANALGLPEIGNEEREIGPEAFERAGVRVPSGRLTAMMLDIKRTWDDVVTRYHPDAERRTRLLENRLYEAMSTALAGSQEYMAMEKLYELSVREDDPLDLIVLDTPPANHALDFLEAPSKIIDALDNDATRWLLEPYHQRGRLTKKLFDAGSSFFIRSIARFTGTELLQDLAELLACFQGMYEGFRERARAVQSILSARDTTFVVISTPGGSREAGDFRTRLVERDIQVGALVLNRAATQVFADGAPRDAAHLLEMVRQLEGDPELGARLEEIARTIDDEARAHRAARDRLAKETGETLVALAPQLPRDIHDLTGLDALRRALFS